MPSSPMKLLFSSENPAGTFVDAEAMLSEIWFDCSVDGTLDGALASLQAVPRITTAALAAIRNLCIVGVVLFEVVGMKTRGDARTPIVVDVKI